MKAKTPLFNLLNNKPMLKKSFLLLFLLSSVLLSCNDGWKDAENEYFSFRLPEEMECDEPVAMSDKQHVSGMLAIDGEIVNFLILKDPKLVGPCTDYSAYTNDAFTLNENIDGQEYRLVYLPQKNNAFWLELCIDQKVSIIAKKLPRDKIELFKKIFMSIRLK